MQVRRDSIVVACRPGRCFVGVQPTKLVGLLTPLLPALEGLAGQAEESTVRPEGLRQGPGCQWGSYTLVEVYALALVSARASLGVIYIGNR